MVVPIGGASVEMGGSSIGTAPFPLVKKYFFGQIFAGKVKDFPFGIFEFEMAK